MERFGRRISSTLIYAILAKTESSKGSNTEYEYRMAGTISLLNANPGHASVEIGHFMIFPSYRGTHIASNAIGLLAMFSLADSKDGNGLGMRRVQYQADERNESSLRAAKRMGFVLEGVARWQRVAPKGKVGRRRLADSEADVEVLGGFNVAQLSLCWDEIDIDTMKRVMDWNKPNM